MFDLNSDMFKPIIGARLIREEAERQASLKKPDESSVVHVAPEGPVASVVSVVPEGKGTLNTEALKGGNKEKG